MLGWLLKRRAEPVAERRSSGTGYTAAIMAARESYIRGASGLGELTATVQSCASLWEGAFALADVAGTDLLDRRSMALLARSLAFRGEAVFLIRPAGAGERLGPQHPERRAAGLPPQHRRGGRRALRDGAGGRGAARPARCGPGGALDGTGAAAAGLLSAGLLHELEGALRDVFRDAPLGTMIVPLDAGGGEALEEVRGSLRGRRGGALVVEYLSQAIAGGAPVPGRGPDHLTPPLRDSMAVETLDAARCAIANAFGVLPALLNPATTGPLVREAQRHLATWTLQPIAALAAEEASAKLGAAVAIDVHRPLQSFDAGGSARAVAGLVQALAQAKEAGLSDSAVAAAFSALDWTEARG